MNLVGGQRNGHNGSPNEGSYLQMLAVSNSFKFYWVKNKSKGIYRAAEKPKYFTCDDLVLSDAVYYQKRGINYKALTCFLRFYYYCFSKITLTAFRCT